MKRTAAHRAQLAFDHLLQGHSGSATVAYLTETTGISQRQARRDVAAAYERLQRDIEDCGIDRRKLTAQLVHGLQEALAKALATNHTSSVVGAARELRELLRLNGDAT
jgi:hypothetical protein